MNEKLLIEKAREAMKYAYAPYSNFFVGAALLTKQGNVYLGCNVENVSFGACRCAEQVAILKAVSSGEKEFEAIAVVNSSKNLVYPCGVCRQIMSEFGKDLRVIVASDTEIKTHKLTELVPFAFDSF
jgi:cytidine deaminase